MSELTATFDLPMRAGAPNLTRHAVRAILQVWGYTDERWLYNAMLVVTELVANAVRHGGGCVGVDVRVHERTVELGVTDGSSVLPSRRDATEDGGRGLLIVERLSAAWGTGDHHGGKRVWARLLPHPATLH